MKRMPSLSKYLALYEKNPRSQVFAPLAEAYRRLGMYREALDVLQRGLAHHPRHNSALIVLAHVYYDTQKYQKALEVLRPLVPGNLDRYSFQKLYAEINLKLGHREEALETAKGLVFLNPKDRGARELLGQIEGEKPTTLKVAQEDPPVPSEGPIEEWSQVDFAGKMATDPGPEEVVGADLPRETAAGETEGGSGDDEVLMTHTLVDLYRDQGLTHKAMEVLQKIIQRNPEDALSREKLQRLEEDLLSQRSGQRDLMGLWDQKFSSDESKGDGDEGLGTRALLKFLHAIQSRGREVLGAQEKS